MGLLIFKEHLCTSTNVLDLSTQLIIAINMCRPRSSLVMLMLY